MQPSGRVEDMQALLVDLRPAPDSLVGGRRTSEPASVGPPVTTNAMLGRFVGVPLQGPMLARIMPPGGPSAATALQAGGQSSSIQVQPGGANMVRLSLSNKVFLKDHRKEKKKKKRPPSMEPMMIRQPSQQDVAYTPTMAEYGVAMEAPDVVEASSVMEHTGGRTLVKASGEPMTAVAEAVPSATAVGEAEGTEEEPTNIWFWIVVFLLLATVITLAVLLLFKPELLDALLPANEKTQYGLARRAVVTEALTADA